MNTNSYDGTAATIIPQNVEKIPLFHWRPGARLLAVGSRDGANFYGDLSVDRSTYRRSVDPVVIREAVAKQQLDGVLACWSASLAYIDGLATVRGARSGALVIATPGVGDPELLEDLLAEVDAWLLLCPAIPGPLVERIVTKGKHVEVLIGLNGDPIPAISWDAVSAVHLCAVRAAEADRLDVWCTTARIALPAGLPTYDHHHPHTDCAGCGERIVWRHGGRSRVDGLDAVGKCTLCGVQSRIQLHG